MAQLGFLYQGQYYSWQKDRRGTPSAHLPPESLVCFLQNHDQVANSARGERLQSLTDPGRFRALTVYLDALAKRIAIHRVPHTTLAWTTADELRKLTWIEEPRRRPLASHLASRHGLQDAG